MHALQQLKLDLHTFCREVWLARLIGASVSEPLFSDVYVDFVCHGPSSGIATAHASYFLHMDCTAW